MKYRLTFHHWLSQEKKRKWDSLSSGEALFGLPVTPHPELQQTGEELAMLGRLYSLYKTVIDSIHGYGDYLWSEVVAQVSVMQEQVVMFQGQAKKLPKVRAGGLHRHTCSAAASEWHIPLLEQYYKAGTFTTSCVFLRLILALTKKCAGRAMGYRRYAGMFHIPSLIQASTHSFHLNFTRDLSSKHSFNRYGL